MHISEFLAAPCRKIKVGRACRPHGELPLPPHLGNLLGVGTSRRPNRRKALPCGRPPPSLPPFSPSPSRAAITNGVWTKRFFLSLFFLRCSVTKPPSSQTTYLAARRPSNERPIYPSILYYSDFFSFPSLAIDSPAGASPYNPSQSHPPIFFIAGT